MRGDTIDNYIGHEAEWVALCAFDCIEFTKDKKFTEADAPNLIDSVWEFCEENCKEAGTIAPSKDEVNILLIEMIKKWNTQRCLD